MKTMSTFPNATWDFTNVWSISPAINNGYPYLQGDPPLPVELTSFTASTNNNLVNLNWKTATEVNNYGFEIERLQNSKNSGLQNWVKIGFVIGNGNSNSPKEYSFIDNPLGGNKFEYRLKQIDNDGEFKYSNTIEVALSAPTEFSLEQNYPNPFNPTTTIRYSIPKLEYVTLKVYDELGKEVLTLVDENKEAGNYEVQFNSLQTTINKQLASGIYFYWLTAGSFTRVNKMLLIK